MAIRIDAKDLSKEVSGLLDKFGQTAENVMSEAVVNTAQEVVREFKTGKFGFEDRKYHTSWTYKMESKRLYAVAKVYNKKYYRLTHLLEFGHARRGGGRDTTAYPHFEPINERVPDIFVEKFTNALAKELTK